MNRGLLIFGPGLSLLMPVLGLIYFMDMWKYYRKRSLFTVLFAVLLALLIIFAILPAAAEPSA